MLRLPLIAILSLVTVIVGMTPASECHAGPPTIDEVLAVHRQNLERLQSLHLQATITTEWTDAFRSMYRQKVQDVEKSIELLESGQLTIEDVSPQLAQSGYTLPLLISTLKSELKGARALSDNTQIRQRVEVFIDGNDYQVRTPIGLPVNDERNWHPPETVLSAETLRSDYGAVRIYSRSQTLVPKARVWCGVVSSTGSPQTALVLDGHFNEALAMGLPPYLSAIQTRWDMRHPIAEFFKDPAQEYEVVREELVDGRAVVVVDALVPHDLLSSKLDEDGNTVEFQAYDFYRGWLDMSRGAVPVRLQWWHGSKQMDREQTATTQPKGTLTTRTIQELSGGAFYPMVTVCEQYGPVSSSEQNLGPTYEVHERKTWDCTRLTSPKKLPDSFFVLDFPKGQDFYDLDEHKVVGALDRKPAVKAGTVAPPLAGAMWLDGQDRSLEEFRGRVVVIDFWGLWCSACRTSIPALMEVQEHYRDQPVTFIAIHTAETFPKELANRIREFAGDQNWQFLQAIDSGTASHNSAIANAFGVSGYPTEIVIGPDGRVTFNSNEPPTELEDIIGKACDEVTPEEELRMQTYMRGQYAAAGIELPGDGELTQEEQSRLVHQLHVHQLKQRIKAALQQTRDH